MKNNESILPYVGFFQVQIDIPACRSVKERRQVVRSLIDKIRRRWNVSAIDLGPENRWDQAYLAFSLVGTSYGMCKDRIEALKNFLEREEEMATFNIIHFWQEVDAYGDLSDAED
ncbi:MULTISPECIES: DUF503 domain-containing protein [Aminobacterium]|jgi:uncharacterized protein YlxP (DUF503 family)|uniref:DUF503 domain-containing protein n=1 Tax=Aminobacterium colombiense (strain DSM 12261 / ALA-1) TaxID=572547 RepID=D5EEW4_AMICL|nr:MULTISPECIES: DUF503 domain-containing protein [Aminobacterium]MDD2378297.1 DUF503 domain-containing protein [Aminobacterium colombiense]ADE57096.1 protein of unknown function DUF503 [Aminobacterium colombiense DSM 12261]MDD3768262.1 DUF503 domain-containing protein [Aminobacterium colombiense]MDD4265792.1 DUF503 domain-containing protein [Aminobacterium colombiense]MDD4585117.1 DUF503 domain-containing protein [Aminobacterium colombiense]